MRRKVWTPVGLLAAAGLAAGAVACGGEKGPTPPEHPATIQIVNRRNSGECLRPGGEGACPVNRVWFKECFRAEDDWGSDRLGRLELIEFGEARSWTVEAGCWDLRAEVFRTPPPGQVDTLFQRGLQLAEGSTFTWIIDGEEIPR